MTAPSRQIDEVDGLAQLSFRIQGLLEARASARELSPVAVRLLGILRDRRPTMSELARLIGLDKSSVTGLVDRAERRGLVERVRSPSDGRSVLVRLTDSGHALASEVAVGFAADVRALLRPLPAAERRRLSILIAHVLLADAAVSGVDLFDTVDAEAN